ncbi:MAG: nucleotidyltransferase family protein, partial [Rhodospirillaceae bacterium]
LDQMAAADVTRALVTVHHLADQVVALVKTRKNPTVIISDETEQLLDTGGGIVKALPLLGDDAFFVFGGDTITLDGEAPALQRMAEAWKPEALDVLMLVHPMDTAHGFDGAGDFFVDSGGRLKRRGSAASAPYAYTSIQIMHPRILAGEKAEPYSMNKLWDRAIAGGRIRAIVNDGEWFHVGTPDAVEKTSAALRSR